MAAPTPATAANGITIDTTGGAIFTGRARGITIANRSSSGGVLLVNISGMHAPGEFVGIEPSTVARKFKASNLSLGTVTVKAASSTCVIDWGVSEV